MFRSFGKWYQGREIGNLSEFRRKIYSFTIIQLQDNHNLLRCFWRNILTFVAKNKRDWMLFCSRKSKWNSYLHMVHLSILEDYFLAELLIFARHLLQFVYDDWHRLLRFLDMGRAQFMFISLRSMFNLLVSVRSFKL